KLFLIIVSPPLPQTPSPPLPKTFDFIESLFPIVLMKKARLRMQTGFFVDGTAYSSIRKKIRSRIGHEPQESG
ncbi:hypothetical protein, partial [Bilophila wadsworthia]|uniref:hypothetical protein n=1 Tax=Bilophila wadsworthia TaxID=35833 RepID=UPI003A83F069